MHTSLRPQQTLAGPVRVEGFGYWSGLDVRVECRPANENSGIVFVRPDLPDCPRLPAHVTQRTDVDRRTVLGNGRLRVEMVEHLMAALGGLQIDNCEVWIDRDELPGLDGSAAAFVEALQRAGIRRQAAPRERLVVTHPLRVGDDSAWIEARPAPHRFSLDVTVDYPDVPAIGKQSFSYTLEPQSFCEQLASARTFILQQEAEQLLQRGLCSRVQHSDVLVFEPTGVVGNRLRFPDECVRHKALDLIGDFALVPFDIIGHFTSFRSGHQLNAEMVKRVLQEGQFLGATQQDLSAYVA